MSEQNRRTSSGATHLAMVACILIGVFAYVGWKLKNSDKATTASTDEKSAQDALTASALARDLSQIAPATQTDPDTPLDEFTSPAPAADTPAAPDITDLTNLIPDTSQQTVSGMPSSEPSSPSTEIPAPHYVPETLGTPAPAPAEPETPREIEEAIPDTPVYEAPTTFTPDTPHILYHTVQRGETLSKLAERYLRSRARAKEIFDANRDLLPSADMLAVGMRLKIPGGMEATESPLTHKITSGDTLPSVAIMYYKSAKPEIIELLRNANPALRSGGFKVGTILVIPTLNGAPHQSESAEAAPTIRREISDPTPPAREYTVCSGDTLTKIASKLYRNKNRWRDIYAINKDKLPSPNKLYVGMKLKLP